MRAHTNPVSLWLSYKTSTVLQKLAQISRLRDFFQLRNLKVRALSVSFLLAFEGCRNTQCKDSWEFYWILNYGNLGSELLFFLLTLKFILFLLSKIIYSFMDFQISSSEIKEKDETSLKNFFSGAIFFLGLAKKYLISSHFPWFMLHFSSWAAKRGAWRWRQDKICALEILNDSLCRQTWFPWLRRGGSFI